MWWKEIRNENDSIIKWNEKWIGNGIGDEGAKRISESLKINTSLTELNLEGDEKIRNEKERIKWEEMKEMNSEQNRRWRS